MLDDADVGGEVHRSKHLYMFSLHPPVTPVPAHPPPSEVEMRWLSAAEWQRCPSLLPKPEEVVRERYADGGRCLVMQRRDGGELVYQVWVSPSAVWTDWIGGPVTPPDGHGIVFDLWAHPAWRRGRLHLPGGAAVIRLHVDLGLHGLVAGVEEHEIVPYARMYARAGLGWVVPYEVVVWHRDGPRSWHDTRQPEAHLVESCEQIRRRYEEP